MQMFVSCVHPVAVLIAAFCMTLLIIIIYIYIPIFNVYKHRSSVNCTQYGLYNLKRYDHNQILNEFGHITLLHTINICAE